MLDNKVYYYYYYYKFKCCVGQLGHSKKMRWLRDIPFVLKKQRRKKVLKVKITCKIGKLPLHGLQQKLNGRNKKQENLWFMKIFTPQQIIYFSIAREYTLYMYKIVKITKEVILVLHLSRLLLVLLYTHIFHLNCLLYDLLSCTIFFFSFFAITFLCSIWII